jgi:hypothetical protein
MNHWLGAAIAIAAGIVVGQVLGRIVRRLLSNERQPPAIREVAPSIGGFVLGICVAAGCITAVGIIDPDQLATMPRGLVNYFPKVIVAGAMVLIGKIAASIVGMIVGRSVQTAAGQPNQAIVKVVKGIVLGAAAILAVAQLGIDTTIVNLAVAALLFSTGATLTLLTSFGGRDVARNVAAARYIRRVLPVGAELTSPVNGTVVKVHPASVEVQRADGVTVHLPAAELLGRPLEFRPPT